MHILIIEDEELSAEDLADTLSQLNPDIQILEVLPSVKAALEYFSKNPKVDLIFSDIQLQDGLSFEIFKQVDSTTPVIFCTAYDEYALEAIKSNGIDYILKPFSKMAVHEALKKYENLKSNFSFSLQQIDRLQVLLDQVTAQQHITSLLVYYKDKIIPIKISDIALFYIRHELTQILTFSGKTYTIDKTMEQLESCCGQQFFRANRQHLIHARSIVETIQYLNRKLLIKLSVPFDDEILVSKTKVQAYLEWLTKA
ncbi:MAG TPA: response regulator [Cytophagales bacterium]|nr:response regulator [Cytophagales bacterium]